MSRAVITAVRTTQAGLNFCLLTYNCCMYNKTQNVLIHNETGLPIGVIWGNISAVSKIFFLCLWSRIPICSKSCSSMMLVPCNIQSGLEYEPETAKKSPKRHTCTWKTQINMCICESDKILCFALYGYLKSKASSCREQRLWSDCMWMCIAWV